MFLKNHSLGHWGAFLPNCFSYVELQKEQADVEITKRQLQSGKKIKNVHDPVQILRDDEMFNMVSSYQKQFEDDVIL